MFAPAPRLRAALTTAAVLAPMLLTGCEKPTPLVTVQSRDKYTHDEALCWREEGAVTAAVCGDGEPREILAVRPNEPVLINVDPPVEEAGWTATLNGRPLVDEPLHSSSFRFDMPLEDLRANPVLRVRAQAEGDAVRGEWAFRIQQRK